MQHQLAILNDKVAGNVAFTIRTCSSLENIQHKTAGQICRLLRNLSIVLIVCIRSKYTYVFEDNLISISDVEHAYRIIVF